MLYNKPMTELSEMLAKKQVSSVEVVKDMLNRINTVNKNINAFITISDEQSLLEKAAESDKRRAASSELSPFDGIPIAVKDNMCTKGILTTCASKILNNFVPPYNATVYQKLLDSGFLLAGKTNMDEFAMGSTNETSFFGPVKNPHNVECVSGGSSGGSAAATASKMVPCAIGSDTGGSIRQPASFCGVTGIKPTYGRVSRYGLVAYASSLDQIGSFGRTVEDASRVLEIISGLDSKDATTANVPVERYDVNGDVKGLRIGVPEEFFNGVNEEIRKAVMDKISELEKQGAVVKKMSMKMIDFAIPVYYLIATAEASSNLARFDGVKYGYKTDDAEKLLDIYLNTRSEGFGEEVQRRIILGTFSLSSGYYDAYYLKALKGRTIIINDFRKAFETVDVIISPTTTSTAFKMGEKISNPLEMYLSDILTISANLAALPGISVPIGKDSSGMPIGMQIMGWHFKEGNIINAAKAIESISEKVDIDY